MRSFGTADQTRCAEHESTNRASQGVRTRYVEFLVDARWLTPIWRASIAVVDSPAERQVLGVPDGDIAG